ncbi:hypothetical protein ACHWQZ_G019273 [Mnemiopsis leidyi]
MLRETDGMAALTSDTYNLVPPSAISRKTVGCTADLSTAQNGADATATYDINFVSITATRGMFKKGTEPVTLTCTVTADPQEQTTLDSAQFKWRLEGQTSTLKSGESGFTIVASAVVATSEVKKMDNKLIIDNADITADTGIVCLYDTEHVKTETTLDVVDVTLTGVSAAAKYSATIVTCSVTGVLPNTDPGLTVTWTVGSTLEDGVWSEGGGYSASKKIDIAKDEDLDVKCEVKGPGGFHYTASITIDVIKFTATTPIATAGAEVTLTCSASVLNSDQATVVWKVIPNSGAGSSRGELEIILNDRATQSFNEGVLTAKTTIANPQFDFSWECVVDYLGESMKVRRALIWIGIEATTPKFIKIGKEMEIVSTIKDMQMFENYGSAIQWTGENIAETPSYFTFTIAQENIWTSVPVGGTKIPYMIGVSPLYISVTDGQTYSEKRTLKATFEDGSEITILELVTVSSGPDTLTTYHCVQTGVVVQIQFENKGTCTGNDQVWSFNWNDGNLLVHCNGIQVARIKDEQCNQSSDLRGQSIEYETTLQGFDQAGFYYDPVCNEIDFSHTEAAAKMFFTALDNQIRIVYNEGTQPAVIGTVNRTVYPRRGSANFTENTATPFWYYPREGALYWGQDRGQNVWQGAKLGACMDRPYGLMKAGTHVDINHHLILHEGATSNNTQRYVSSFTTLDHTLNKTVEVRPYDVQVSDSATPGSYFYVLGNDPSSAKVTLTCVATNTDALAKPLEITWYLANRTTGEEEEVTRKQDSRLAYSVADLSLSTSDTTGIENVTSELTISRNGGDSNLEMFLCKVKTVEGKLENGVAYVDFTEWEYAPSRYVPTTAATVTLTASVQFSIDPSLIVSSETLWSWIVEGQTLTGGTLGLPTYDADALQQITETSNTFPFRKSSLHNQIVLRIVDPEEKNRDRTIKYLDESGDVVNFITFQTSPTSNYTTKCGVVGTLETLSVWKNCTSEKEMNFFIYRPSGSNILYIHCTNLGTGDSIPINYGPCRDDFNADFSKVQFVGLGGNYVKLGEFQIVNQPMSLTVDRISDSRTYVLKDKFNRYPATTTVYTYSIVTKAAAAPPNKEATLTCAVTLTNTQVEHQPIKFEWYKQDSSEVLKTETPASKESTFIVPSGTPDTNFVCKVTFASGDSEEKIVTFDSFEFISLPEVYILSGAEYSPECSVSQLSTEPTEFLWVDRTSTRTGFQSSETVTTTLQKVETDTSLTCSVTVLGNTYTRVTQIKELKVLHYTPRAVVSGESFTLNCKVLEGLPVSISWFYYNESGEKTAVVDGEKYSVTGGGVETDSNTGDSFQESLLKVESLQEHKQFYCAVTREIFIAVYSTAEYQISVYPYTVTMRSVHRVQVNTEVSLRVNITGLPATLPTSTTWTKLGSEVSLSNEVSLSSEVSLSNVSPSNEVSLSNDTIYQINDPVFYSNTSSTLYTLHISSKGVVSNDDFSIQVNVQFAEVDRTTFPDGPDNFQTSFLIDVFSIDAPAPVKALLDTQVEVSCTIRGISDLVVVDWSNPDGSEIIGAVISPGLTVIPESGTMSSFNPWGGYQNAFDNNLSSLAHSSDEITTGNQHMDLTFDKTYTILSVNLTVWRWDADWCQNSLEDCRITYERLGGVRIRVSKTGESSFVECGTVPQYTAPALVSGIVPDPIVKTVKCPAGTEGDKMNLYQTMEGVRLMISEIEIVGIGSESQTSTLLLPKSTSLSEKEYKCTFRVEDGLNTSTLALVDYFSVDPGTTVLLKNGTSLEMTCTVRGLLQETSFTWGYALVVEDTAADKEIEEKSIAQEFVQFDVAMVTQGTLQTGTDGTTFQTSILKVEGDIVTSSKKIRCRVHASETVTPQVDSELYVYSIDAVTTEIAEAGSVVTLGCTIRGLNAVVPVKWYTSNNTPISEDLVVTGVTITDTADSVPYQTSTVSLTRDMTVSDGSFVCNFTSGDFWDSGTAALDVFNLEFASVTATAGSTATMVCMLTDVNNTLTVVWRNENQELIGNGDGYTATKGTAEDGTQVATLVLSPSVTTRTQQFTCQVLDQNAVKAERTATFNVNINPSVTVTDREVRKGTETTISCSLTELNVEVGISWWDGDTQINDENGYSVTPVAFNPETSTQGSEMKVTSPQSDKIYTCKVSYNGEVITSKSAQLNVFDMSMLDQEIKAGSSATLSCVITEVSTALKVEWLKSTGDAISTGGGFTVYSGTVTDNTQLAELVVETSLTNSDKTYTCKVKSSTFPSSPYAQITARLNVFHVESVNKEVKQGSTTIISCVITGITDTATVSWRTSTGEVSGDEFTADQGSHTGGTQTSTLAVDGTQVNVNTAYTCRVTSGSIAESEPFDTTVHLNVFDVQSVNKEVKKGSTTTISCVITGITDTATVSWRTSTEEVSGDEFTAVQGSHSDGTQTSTLAVDGTQVDIDTAYTCRVTSGSLPGSGNFDTTVNLNVFDVESVNKEVKKGSTTTISCVITGITDTATVSWRTSTGEVSGDKFTADQGSHTGGTQTSTLAVDGTQVNGNTAYTCRVTSGSLPGSGNFDTTVNLNVFDVESVNKEVKKGSTTTISCMITGITDTATVSWRTSTGEVSGDEFTVVQGSHSDGTQTSTLAVDGTQVDVDTAYTCRVTSGSLPGSGHFDSTVNLNVFDVASVNKEVKKGSTTIISCMITGITDTATVSWRTSTGEVSGDKFTVVQGSFSDGTQTSTLAVDGTQVNIDTAYTCRVTSGSLPGSGNFDTTVNLNVFELQGQSKEIFRSSTASFNCNLLDSNLSGVFSWKSQNNGDIGSDDSRYSVTSNLQSSLISLSRSSTDVSDVFTCTVTFQEAHAESSSLELKLHVYDITPSTEVLVQAESPAKLYCNVSNLDTGSVATVWWKRNSDGLEFKDEDGNNIVSGTPVDSSQTNYISLDSTLTKSDDVYTCLVEVTVGEVSQFSVTLNTFSVTPMEEHTHKNEPATLYCTIKGAGKQLYVKWTDNQDQDLLNTAGYTIVQGELADDSQSSVMTISGEHTGDDAVYNCHVSPDDGETFYTHSVELNVLGVTVTDREVKKGTETTLTCSLTELTVEVVISWWDGETQLTETSEGYSILPVAFNAETSTQGSRLTVTNPTTDKVYTCKVHHNSEEVAVKAINLNVYDMTMAAREVGSGSTTTFTCTMTDLTSALTLTWLMSDDSTISTGGGYTINPGSVDASGIQTSTLVVGSSHTTQSTTVKCKAQSSTYPQSAAAVIAANLNIYQVTQVNSEVQTGTTSTISCVITGITDTATVSWRTSTGEVSGDKFTAVQGSHSDGTQTSTLAVDGTQVTTDLTYTCRVISGSLPESGHFDTTVNLKVFDVISTAVKDVTTAVDQTLTCTVRELDVGGTPATVTWKDPNGVVVEISDTTNYAIAQGAVDDTGQQNAELTIKPTKLSSFSSQTTFTYKCSVTSSQYPRSPASTELEIVANVLTFAVAAVNQEQLEATEAKISCTVSGLTKALDDVKWTKYDDTPITSGEDDFVIADGTLSDNSQTTILTVPGSANTLDTTYKCLITSTEHGKTDDSTSVSLKVFTLTSTTKQVTTAVDQTLTCVIGGLDANGDPVTVTWKDPSGTAVSDTDTTNYGLGQGTVDGAGVQNSELTIKVSKLGGFSSSFTYKCSAQYSGSPSSGEIDVVADILTFAVAAVNQEQLEATEAKISCTVSGLTKALDDVKWTKSDDTPITSGEDDFVIAEGTLSGNSQTTILTVPGSANTLDITYKCLITSTEHGKTDDSTSVSLKVYTLTSTTKQVTTAVDQTLTCVIGGLDANGDPVTVTWKDPSGNAVSDTDTTNYDLAQGTVDGAGVQNAGLTIKVAKLGGFSSSFTYKCSAQYSGSPSSGEIDVVADILTFAVAAVNQEQLEATVAMISCTVSGLTKALDDVKWTKSDDTPITSGVDDFVIADGTLSGNSQTTILTVPSSANTLDTTYKCLITSTEHGKTDYSTSVSLKVFTLTSTTKKVTTAVDQTLTCVVEGLDANGVPVTVTWKDPSGNAVPDTDTTNYDLAQGTVDGAGVQNAGLTIKVAKLGGFSSSFTYKCSAQYSGSPSSGEIDVVADILTFAVAAVNQEQLEATEAMISCTVSGLTKALDDVKWTKSDDTPITSGVDDFVIADGTLSGNSQTTILTVPGSANTLDTTYKCLITSTEHGKTDDSTSVSLKVFTLTSTTKQVTTAVDQTLTCVVEGLDANGVPVTVIWKDPSGNAVSDTDTTNYDLAQGTVDGAGVQNAELTIKVAKLGGLSSSFTYKCSAQYSGSPSSGEIDVVADILTFAVAAVNQEQLEATEAKISCTVSGLTKALDDVKWTKSDDTPITSGEDDFVIADGTLSGNSQTTILTVPGSANTLDTTYKCLITSTEHGKTDDSTSVSLKVFTLTSTTKQVTTAVDQTLTCIIRGLDANGVPVTVTWKDPSGNAVSDSDTTNYDLAQGTVDGAGVQNAVLTIKIAKLGGFSSSFTYKCSAQYSGSPSSGEIDVVADILTFAVAAVNQKQLEATEAKISCTVSGLTKALDDVKWTKSDDTPITSGEDDFVIAEGTLSGNSQTTILTVPGSANTVDTTYKCLITSTEHGKTDDSTSVSLKVFALTSTTKQVTTAVDQTLTCVIGGLDANGVPVTVTWKDPSGNAVSDSDTTNYDLAQGTVDGAGVQNAVLTIKVAKLSVFSSSFTYRCSAQYSGSPSSGEIDVVADILTFAVAAVNQEQLEATEAMISCTVSGLTKALDDVKWTKSDDTPITSGEDDFVITDGTLSDNSQTTILTVSGFANTIDTTYKCHITSTEHGKTDDSTSVSLKVFTLTSTAKQVTTAVDQTLTCTIGELDASGTPVTVTWTDPDGAIISNIDTANYALAQGTVDGTGVQNAELTIKTDILGAFSSQTTFTYKCSAQYSGSPASSNIDVVANVLTFAVTAIGQEQLKATEGKISCTVDGLTKSLDGVKWTKSDDTAITSGVGGFVIADGTLSGNTQTVVLTVPATANTVDNSYNCVITSNEHDKTDDSTSVSLKVFTVTSSAKDVTTAVDQTLTCTIGELDANGTPVTVDWKDPNNDDVLNTDTTNYDLSPGTVDSSGVQHAELTIKSAKLADFSSQATFTYKCYAQYSGSPASAEVAVVANVFSFALTSVSQDTLKGTEAKISCIVTSLTKALDDVKWTKSDDALISSGINGFIIEEGTLSDDTQTTVLTVPGSENSQDTVYKCLVTSREHGKVDEVTTATVEVFDVSPSTEVLVQAESPARLFCNITGLDTDSAANVWWKRSSDGQVFKVGIDNNVVSDSKVGSDQANYIDLDSTMTTSDDSFTCFVEVFVGDIAEFLVSLDSFTVTPMEEHTHKYEPATLYCTIEGAGKQLYVKWTDNQGQDLHNTDGYTIDEGELSDGSQRSVMTISGEYTGDDAVYKCLVSPDDGETFYTHSVELNVLGVTVTDREVKKGTETTLTCSLTELTVEVVISWWDGETQITGASEGFTVSTVGFNAETSTQGSQLTVTNPTTDKVYTCKVHHNSEEVAVKAINLNVYDMTMAAREVGSGSTTTFTCTMTDLTSALTVTWLKSDDSTTSTGGGYTINPGSVDASGIQTSTLVVGSSHTTQSTTVKCKAQSSTYPQSAAAVIAANLNIYDVQSVNKEVKQGSTTTISCVITGITETATVSWRTSTGEVSGDKFTAVQGSHSEGTQTSTLAVDGTQVTVDTAYTCRVTSGSLSESGYFDTTVNLYVFDVQSVDKEVKQGSTTTISCVITGITETATVSWRTSTGEVSGDKFTAVQGSHSDGTQTSTLSVDGTQVTVDTAYTCRVTSGSLSESGNFDTTVNLNVFDVQSVNKEVKQGSTTTISCVITGITETATVSWRTSTGEVSGDKFTAVQGSHSEGTQTSTLAVDGTQVTIDTAYTCRVISGSVSESGNFDTTVNLNVFDVQSVNKEVKQGSTTTISCVITGITDTATVSWRTSTGEVSGDKFTAVQGSHSDGTQTSTLAVDGTQVTIDTAYTCRVTSGSLSDSGHFDTTVNLNVFDVHSVNKEVKQGSTTTISCVITGITDTATVSWRTSTGEVSGNKFTAVQGSFSDGTQTSTLAVDGTQVTVDTAYTCRVTSGSLSDSGHFDTTVNLNVFEITTTSYDVSASNPSILTCSVSGVSAGEVDFLWLDNSGKEYNDVNDNTYSFLEGTLVDESQTTTITLKEALTSEDQIFTCRVVLEEQTYFDTEIPLKVFDVSAVGDAIQSGKSATLSCSVINPTDTLTVAWFDQDNQLVAGTTKSTTADQTTLTELTLESQVTDSTYTCKVSGHEEYTFTASVEINDLSLKPMGDSRVFEGMEFILTCSYISITISEGSFSWIYNDNPCTLPACSNPLNTAKSSKLTLTVDSSTAGNWRCSFNKESNSKEIKSNEVTVKHVALGGTQSPDSAWGIVGTQSSITCVVPNGLALSTLNEIS